MEALANTLAYLCREFFRDTHLRPPGQIRAFHVRMALNYYERKEINVFAGS